MKSAPLIVLAVVAAACLARAAWAQTWTLETVAGPTDYQDFAIDEFGTLHVVHANPYSSPNPELAYMFDSGDGWQAEVVPAVPRASLISLVTDDAGVPHIAFVDPSNTVRYAHRTGGAWTIESLQPSELPYNPTIALDESGGPHIAFITYGDRIRHAFKSGGSWTDEEVDGSFLSASQSRAVIAVDPAGIPRIGSRDQFDGVTYFTRQASSWTHEHFGEWGYMTWMTLDESGNAHFVYTGDGVHYATNESGPWVTQDVDTSLMNDCDITLDANGRPYIAYSNTYAIRYQHPNLYYHTDVYFAYQAGGVWRSEVVDATHDYTGNYYWSARVAFDGSGTPHVVYRDASTGALKHATRNWPTAVGDDPRPASFGIVSIAPNPFNPSARITFRLSGRSHVEVAVYDVRGRRLRLLADRAYDRGLHSEVWDGFDDRGARVASGVYFVRVKTPTHSDVRRAVLSK